MTTNGFPNLTDVPRLMERWREGRGNSYPYLLQARTALMDASEGIVQAAVEQSRGMTAKERCTFDEHTAQVREINAELETYRRLRIEGIVAMGFDASEARFCF